jgi:hypothetical protein
VSHVLPFSTDVEEEKKGIVVSLAFPVDRLQQTAEMWLGQLRNRKDKALGTGRLESAWAALYTNPLNSHT